MRSDVSMKPFLKQLTELELNVLMKETLDVNFLTSATTTTMTTTTMTTTTNEILFAIQRILQRQATPLALAERFLINPV